MNNFAVRLAAISVLTIILQAAVSQSTGTKANEMKHVDVPMPKGFVRAEALDIDKDWTPPIVHLKGAAYVRIYTATKAPLGAIVIRADEVDLNQTTGEIFPRGNVRLTVEDFK